jgi:MFS family permease
VRRRYLVAPFLCCLAPWTCGNGTIYLLPLYAKDLGATQAVSGLILGFAFLCIALGSMTPGLLPKGFRHRRLLLVASGALMIVLAWLGGRVTSALQLALETGALWFVAGVVFSQCAIMVGLAAEPKDRGTAFGILGMTNGLGSLIGGSAVGPLADRFGYGGAYDFLAVFCALAVIGGLASAESPVSSPADASHDAPDDRRPFGSLLVLLFSAQILVATAFGPGALGRSFSMDAGGLSKSAITLTGAIGGPVGLGISLFMGRLSDKVGRRPVLIASFLVTTGSLVFLVFSRVFWQFCAFAVLNAFIGVFGAVGPAYVVDIDPQGNVGRNVSFFQSAGWVGNIAGIVGTRYAFEKLGTATSILIAGLLPVFAVVLLLLIRSKARANDQAQPQAVR